jgi:MYXO-CTERM domain-containing protein
LGQPRQTPGFETFLAVAAMVAFALMRRR